MGESESGGETQERSATGTGRDWHKSHIPYAHTFSFFSSICLSFSRGRDSRHMAQVFGFGFGVGVHRPSSHPRRLGLLLVVRGFHAQFNLQSPSSLPPSPAFGRMAQQFNAAANLRTKAKSQDTHGREPPKGERTSLRPWFPGRGFTSPREQ
ncbi:hypothetical protein RB213_013113 [Colletotrichum asianum]